MMLKIICVALLTVGGALGQGGKFATFPVPGSVEIGVNSINSAGTVVGITRTRLAPVW
ncbi:MAG: hypothetical protein ABSC93_07480 [Bryobacteraceae bacterium]|jgi:hypothetical protein